MISTYEYYSQPEVRKEILDFSKGRWMALHYTNSSGNLFFRRYLKGKPISAADLDSLVNQGDNMLRSIYATANVYNCIRNVEDVYDPSNILYCTPTWDIDSFLSKWRKTLNIAKKIIRFLNSWGVKKSVYIKWSGNGCHIHINEKSISEDLREKHNPLDLAYAIVEYVNSKLSLKPDYLLFEKIKVENKMDPARVFTCPLSLHRKLNVACICMKPEEINEFTPKWINPQNFKHNSQWRDFEEGESDKLAKAAYAAVGGYPLKFRGRFKPRKTKPLDKQILEWLMKD